ncbi:MAG: methyltransferase domain-containing protein [Chloroflexi bacterium]|nr:methyltransferase domain-containing protein [Chloroflexota bacterium]
MTHSSPQIQTDFDRLAVFSTDGWDHNNHYHDFLLRHLPPHIESALDIGCGTGTFSRRLAQRSERVLGIDLSPQMIQLARERSSAYPHIEYEIADVMTKELGEEQFNCIASIATIHHLPFDEILSKIKRALKPSGTLVVLDLYEGQGISDPMNWLATPASIALQFIKTGHPRRSAEELAAWDEHGKHESYLTLAQIKQSCSNIIPGAQVRKHLLWRYSIVWSKDANSH